MITAFLLLCSAMLCAGIGNIFLSRGMKQVGTLASWRPAVMGRFFLRSASNRNVLAGVLVSCGYFFLWLVVLSLADVSWALPMNGIEYLMVAFLAQIFLKERVTKERWIGIGLISTGIFFMIGSW